MVYFLLVLNGVVTALGITVVVLIQTHFSTVERLAQRSLPKFVVALCRASLALTAVLGKEAIAGIPQGQVDWRWVWTAIVVVIGWFLWEVADWRAATKLAQAKESVDQKHQATIKELEQKLQAANRQVELAEQIGLFRVRLLSALRGLVNTKNQRVRQELKNPTSKVPIQRARESLAPQEHVAFALDSLALFLFQQLPHEEGSTRQNFRVCLYIASGGVLSPLDGFDLRTKKHHPFKSHLDHADRFRLDNKTDPAHAVQCIQDRRLLIVPDCATDADFKYFSPEQRMYLQSMVAYPIIEFRETPQGEQPAALVIDTDVPNHFKEEDRESIELLMGEFAARLILEDAILKVTTS